MKFIVILAGIVGLVVIVFIIEILLAVRSRGEAYQFPVSRSKTVGSGTEITYVILGDSTAAGQGGDYSKSIAELTLKHLATEHKINAFNFAESGAQTIDVLKHQLPQALKQKPDVVLLVVGANDVTHLTWHSSLKKDLNLIVEQLNAANCEVKIVLTGAPQMGVSPRFGPLLRTIAKIQTNKINKIFKQVVAKRNLTFAPIAEQSGPVFAINPHKYFAEDEYHPNAEGYEVWSSILNTALDEAITAQPSHCKRSSAI
jgi:lysophospholipase L1-like esterase